MDYTQNLHLPQWEETDRILHDDFNDAFAAIDTAMPRIVTGTYVGTGEFGSSHKNTLTLPFVPRLLLIFGNMTNKLIVTPDMTACNTSTTNGNEGQIALQWSGTTLKWHTTVSGSNAGYQLNSSGRTYFYIAFN